MQEAIDWPEFATKLNTKLTNSTTYARELIWQLKSTQQSHIFNHHLFTEPEKPMNVKWKLEEEEKETCLLQHSAYCIAQHTCVAKSWFISKTNDF